MSVTAHLLEEPTKQLNSVDSRVTLCESVTSSQSSCSRTAAPETNSCVLTSLTTNTCTGQTEQATNTTSLTAHAVSDPRTATAAQTSTSIQQPAQAASNVVSSSSVHGASGGKCACGLPNPQFCTLNLLNAINNTSSMKAPRRSWVPISVCSTYE